MILLGIDVFKADEAFSCDGISYPAGTFVIPVSQPFGLFIKNVFEEQKYPDLRKYPDLWQGLVASKPFEGAPFEAYDMMGWTCLSIRHFLRRGQHSGLGENVLPARNQNRFRKSRGAAVPWIPHEQRRECGLRRPEPDPQAGGRAAGRKGNSFT